MNRYICAALKTLAALTPGALCLLLLFTGHFAAAIILVFGPATVFFLYVMYSAMLETCK